MIRFACRYSALLASVGLAAIATPAFAQDTSDGAGANAGDIIVTARRTEERLQDVPISISVFNQSQITDRNIVVATDLATYTPSLASNQKYGPEKASFGIRGFNQEPNTAPTVGVYFADVVGLRAQGGTTSGNSVGAGAFMDLQNVQVLKGPQGTLFGRNTTGGAVLLVPNRPTDVLEGWAEGQVGDYGLRRGMGVINIPLADTFKVRLAVDRNRREGYMKNRSGIGPDDYNDVNYFAARLGILAELTPDLENYTLASYSHSFSNGYAGKIAYCDRRYVLGDPSYNQALATNRRNFNKSRIAPAACDQMDRQAGRGDGAYDVEINNPDPRIDLTQWQVINTTSWTVNDWLTVRNIASYGEIEERSSFALYSDNFAVSGRSILSAPANVGRKFNVVLLKPAGSESNAHQSTFTEELQLQGDNLGGRLTWQLGAYFERSRPIGWSAGLTPQFVGCAASADVYALNCTNPLPGGGNVSASATKYDFNNDGLYAQATFDLTDQWAVTGGFRYTMDKIVGQVESTRINFLPGGGTQQVCNDALNFPQPGTNPPTGLVVTSASQCHREVSNKSNRPTWLIDVDFKPANDVLLYAKYARGYRQGGINFTNVAVESWGPEKVDSFEVGTKTSFRGAVSGFLNVAGFYNNLSGQQVLIALQADPTSGLLGGAGIFNAGKSRIWGIEVDGSLDLFDGFRLDAGYTFLNTKLRQIEVPEPFFPYVAFIPMFEVGGHLTQSPKHRVTLTGSYRLPLPESIGKMTLAATYVHTAKQIINESSNPADPSDPAYGLGLGNVPATNLLNLNLNWEGLAGLPVDAGLFVTNVTNEKYPIAGSSSLTGQGFEALQMGAPRMFGVRLRYHFGD